MEDYVIYTYITIEIIMKLRKTTTIFRHIINFSFNSKMFIKYSTVLLRVCRILMYNEISNWVHFCIGILRNARYNCFDPSVIFSCIRSTYSFNAVGKIVLYISELNEKCIIWRKRVVVFLNFIKISIVFIAFQSVNMMFHIFR